MQRELVTRLVPAEAIQWGPTWDDMCQAAELLGRKGLMFKIVQPQQRVGVDVLPELHVYDKRFRPHVVTPGLWIVIHPGYREFRVLDWYQIEREYHFTAEETDENAYA